MYRFTKKKNELKASICVSSNPFTIINSNQNLLTKLYNLISSYQIGYSLSNHLSIFGNGFHCNRVTQSEILRGYDAIYGNYGLKEINMGGGYFISNTINTFEMLFGLGYGEQFYKYNYSDYELYYRFSMNNNRFNLFIQPDWGIKIEECVEMGLFSKFIYSRYYDINIELQENYPEYYNVKRHDYMLDRKTFNAFLIEPGLLFRFGGKKYKCQIQASTVINPNTDKITTKLFYLNASSLFSFNLNRNKKIL